MMTHRVATGLDVLRDTYWRKLKGHRLGYLCNQASVDSRLRPGKQVITERLPGRLRLLFGPQHGFGGEDQDNMVETDHARDRDLDIPILSLYAETREPAREMFEEIEILLIDLQDVGTRVYTFASTMLGCLRVAAKAKIKVLILDRPNPLGGEVVEGNLLRADLYSFVGPCAIPMRHGLTMGELALLFNAVFDLGCDLEILPMNGWRRRMLWQDTGLRWIMPSPNMPVVESAQVYPGQVMWEATNLSEGRGTCRPFEIFGAPFLDTQGIRGRLASEHMSGCYLRDLTFRPTFHKWEGKICHGFMIHILDVHLYQPYLTALALLQAVISLHRDQFLWKRPPYEYEFDKMPIDLILGDSYLRRRLEMGEDLSHIKQQWLTDLEGFQEHRKTFLLYD
ncbi:MAG: exo-beta-N-acetylmuramidase NamZ domain-containing protein [Desulfatiglandales bacterium]